MKLISKVPDRPARSSGAVYVLLSFFLPMLIILAALAGLQIAPFGDKTLVISDANGLYINTLSYAARMLRGLESPLYSFEKGLGGNMMGHLNGILLTPFGFLLCFSRIENNPTVFTFISTLNFSLAGLTMYLLLASLHGHQRSNLLFSTSYAMMGFLVANIFQACFFSAAPVLPVMVLGQKKIFEGKSSLLYIFSLAYALTVNSFFGFVLCVASVLFCFPQLWLLSDRLQGRRLRLFLHWGFSSLCGGLLAAILWLPWFLSLQGGRLEQTGLADFSFGEKMPFLEIGAKLFTGANSTSELVDGLPNIFIGILPLALVILFFLNKTVGKRKKAAAGFLLAVYLLSFWIIAFDMLMHGGTTTNWFNFRYSYVFSFLLLLLASELWQQLDSVPSGDVKRCLGIMVLAALLIFSKKYEFIQGSMVLLDFALLLFFLLAWRMHREKPEKNPRKVLELIALFLVGVNLFLNYRICTKNIMEWTNKLSEYQETVAQVEPLVRGVNSGDSGFFRMEVNKQRSGTAGNDPMLYGYNGVGHGGSNERNFVRTGLSKLGIPWYDMRNYYAEGVPAATDALLGIKYLIAEEDLTAEKAYMNTTHFRDQLQVGEQDSCYDLFYNADALPVAMLSGGEIDAVQTEFYDPFENLNAVWSALSGSAKPVFRGENEIHFIARNFSDPAELDAAEARAIADYYDAKVSASGTEAQSLNVPAGVDKDAPEYTAYIEYSFIAKQDGPVYVYHGSSLSKKYGSMTPALSYLGTYRAGDPVKGYLSVNKAYVDRVLMEEYCGRLRVAYADMEALHELSAIVKARPVTLAKEGETHLRGSFTAESGQVMMLTIPWDEGWSCTVDGAPVEMREVLDVFMAFDVPAGSHSFELRYTPPGLRIGLLISAAALLLTLVYLIIGRERIDRILFKAAAKKSSRAKEQGTDETGTETQGFSDAPSKEEENDLV